jgi:activator of Hsp90 ATPase-like protein
MKEGPMVVTEPTLEGLTLNVNQEIRVTASLEATFDALLEEMGPANLGQEGKPMPMKLEARPGGRWFRDLGKEDGHLWGHVQAIKRPTLLEITGPLFLSYPVVSNVQWRLSEVEGGTLITLRHSALGFMPEDARKGVGGGWASILERSKRRAESLRAAH